MSRIMITADTSAGGYVFKKGQIVEVSPSVAAALGTAGRTLIFRDSLGEAVAASNSSA
jgi:hypothetical protein